MILLPCNMQYAMSYAYLVEGYGIGGYSDAKTATLCLTRRWMRNVSATDSDDGLSSDQLMRRRDVAMTPYGDRPTPQSDGPGGALGNVLTNDMHGNGQYYGRRRHGPAWRVFRIA